MKTFKQFLKEAKAGKTLYFTWGRFDPPTTGHSHLFNVLKVQATTNNADEWLIFPTRNTDYKKTFLTFEERYKFLQELNPRFANKIVDDSNCNTVKNLILEYEKKGFSHFVLIAGSEDAIEYQGMTKAINNDSIYKEYFTDFQLEVPLNIGELKRDEGTGVSGMKSSKLKEAIVKGDKETFIAGIGNEKVANEMWEILQPYNKQLEKYVLSKEKGKGRLK